MTTVSSERPVGRRRFLKTGCMVAAAVGVTVCGAGALAATYQPKIDQPSLSFGEKTVNDRILITYATKAGSTADIAARIGETLSKQNLAVDVLPVAKVTDLSAYSTVITGSAIRMGKLLPEMMTFIQKNQAALQQKSFNAFVVCMTMKDDTEETRKTVGAYLDPVRALVQPAHEGLFAGVIDPSKVGLIDRLAIQVIKAPIGDYRKWDEISAWAGGIPAN
jgi:menaquinone-dependent protoporphyrinogen oxidase